MTGARQSAGCASELQRDSAMPAWTEANAIASLVTKMPRPQIVPQGHGVTKKRVCEMIRKPFLASQCGKQDLNLHDR